MENTNSFPVKWCFRFLSVVTAIYLLQVFLLLFAEWGLLPNPTFTYPLKDGHTTLMPSAISVAMGIFVPLAVCVVCAGFLYRRGRWMNNMQRVGLYLLIGAEALRFVSGIVCPLLFGVLVDWLVVFIPDLVSTIGMIMFAFGCKGLDKGQKWTIVSFVPLLCVVGFLCLALLKNHLFPFFGHAIYLFLFIRWAKKSPVVDETLLHRKEPKSKQPVLLYIFYALGLLQMILFCLLEISSSNSVGTGNEWFYRISAFGFEYFPTQIILVIVWMVGWMLAYTTRIGWLRIVGVLGFVFLFGAVISSVSGGFYVDEIGGYLFLGVNVLALLLSLFCLDQKDPVPGSKKYLNALAVLWLFTFLSSAYFQGVTYDVFLGIGSQSVVSGLMGYHAGDTPQVQLNQIGTLLAIAGWLTMVFGKKQSARVAGYVLMLPFYICLFMSADGDIEIFNYGGYMLLSIYLLMALSFLGVEGKERKKEVPVR